jgi:hypothetical protein
MRMLTAGIAAATIDISGGGTPEVSTYTGRITTKMSRPNSRPPLHRRRFNDSHSLSETSKVR